MTESEKKNADNDDTSNEAVDPPPGPTDQGRVGGMATRELAPELAKKSSKAKD